MDGSFIYLLHFDEIDELIIHAYVKWLRRANETTCSIMAMAAKTKKGSMLVELWLGYEATSVEIQ